MARSRSAAVLCSSVSLAVALVVPPAGGIAAVTRTSSVSVPAKLVGQWTRKVTSADVKRAHASGIPAGSVCTLTVKRTGPVNARLFCTKGVGDFTGVIRPAGAHLVHFELMLFNPSTYRWSVSGTQLTFTKIVDQVGERVAVFWGVWKRK